MSVAATKRPARRARTERVEQILQAAREVFCDKGYDAATVAGIAARVGVVEGTVYKYFDSKSELLLRVLEHWYAELVDAYARDLAGVDGTAARLRLLVWRHLRAIRDYPRLCRLMFSEVRAERDYRGSSLHALNRRYTELLVEVLREGVDAGEIRPELPLPLVRDMIYGGIEHYTWTYLRDGGELDIDATADRIHALLWDGIAARPTALQQATGRLSALVDRLEHISREPQP